MTFGRMTRKATKAEPFFTMTTFTGPLETTILAALSLWAVFYLINYADIPPTD